MQLNSISFFLTLPYIDFDFWVQISDKLEFGVEQFVSDFDVFGQGHGPELSLIEIG